MREKERGDRALVGGRGRNGGKRERENSQSTLVQLFDIEHMVHSGFWSILATFGVGVQGAALQVHSIVSLCGTIDF